MRSVVMHAPGDIRVEDRADPTIEEPTDAVIQLAATCICGSDLWPYRGVEDARNAPMGHEYIGWVEEVGPEVRTIKVGDFVVGSFWASDNTCEICRAGYQSRCVNAAPMGMMGTQAQFARIPLADGTLVATPESPPANLLPSPMAASDVLGTGWFGAVAAEAGPGKTVAVVSDGAVEGWNCSSLRSTCLGARLPCAASCPTLFSGSGTGRSTRQGFRSHASAGRRRGGIPGHG